MCQDNTDIKKHSNKKPITDYQERATYLRDTIRLSIDGIHNVLTHNLFLVIAISFFSLASTSKATIVSGTYIGMTLVLFCSGFLFRLPLRKGQIAAMITLGGAVLLLFAAWSTREWFPVFTLLYMILMAQRIPLFTSIYQENYPSAKRGKLISIGLSLFSLVKISSSLFIGQLLDLSVENFRFIFTCYAFLLVGSAWLIYTIPGSVKRSQEPSNPLRSLRLLYHNKLFGYICLAWFMLGFGNLFVMPIKIEYLTNPVDGLGLSPRDILILVVIIPGVTQIASNYVWGKVYDSLHLILFRILVTFFTMGGVVLFFISKSWTVIALSSALTGIALGGTPIIWNLWVHRIAGAQKDSREYMAIHVFLTGIRGFIAPYFSYGMHDTVSYMSMGFIGAGFIILSIVMFLPLIRHPLLRAEHATQHKQ